MSEVLAPLPVLRFCDDNGNALSGGLLFTYAAGTTSKQTTYTDATGATPNANPIVLNSRGECTCWLPPGLAFKFALSPSTDTDPPTNSFWTVDNVVVPPLVTKATLSSASTVALGGAAADYVSISGTTTINAFDTVPAGTIVAVEFQGSLQLTYNATSLILPGGANITTAAGDTAVFVSEGSGNWRCLWYQRATGAPLFWASGAPSTGPLPAASGGTGVASPTAHAVMVGEGSSAMNPIAPGLQGTVLISNGSGADPSFGVPVLRSYLAGLTLSNDGTSPNTVLDIAAGVAADSTGVVMMSAGAFTKSTGGSWVAGSGQNGMGTGLTVADSTWYHVFQILSGGAVDYYFDTSVTGANKPSGTTALRRIGSILTDASGHILAFTQIGDWFWWKASVAEANINGVTLGTSATSYALVGTPPGVNTMARMGAALTNGSNRTQLWVYPTFMNDEASATAEAQIDMPTSGALTSGVLDVWTDTTPNIRAVTNESGSTVTMRTFGYCDRRGRDN